MEFTLHKEDIERLLAAKRIIETEFKSHYTTEQLAQKVGLNDCKLKSGFRRLFNTSLYKLLTKVRIEKAKDILECKGYAVKSIATTVGFADVPTFIKSFKRNTGLSPNEWRRNSKRKLAS
jgi:AraC family transcriptional regulator, transcriptional activator of the genes for pyochelin and ferripyochelin receptors